MKKFSSINENINTKRVEPISLTYFDLFPLLRGLESERPGIKDRVWEFLCDERDAAFKPYNGRIMNINLFYYGVGEEYPVKGYLSKYPDEVERSKKVFPQAFQDYLQVGSGDKKAIELRKDFNLIWSTYEDVCPNPDMAVITRW